ncbi:hypothetical protein [Rhodoferax sp. TH121]|uniref:hypothetical protein n=1 Tax=Rhodoferax sp. TH121 TaxID=2022803 RepID=UPI0015954972|nr:hypothetical protein [Rhodoferax sp. TH121]
MNPTSPFNWQNQPSQINLGRIKSEQQVTKDANRVNPYSVTARNLGPLKSSTAPR